MKKISPDKLYKILRTIILCELIILFLLSSYKLVSFSWDMYKNNKLSNELVNEYVQEKEDDKFTVDFDKLLKKNNDTKGWIRFNNKKVDYPIVQSSSNTYYLFRDFEKNNSQSGSIFMDYRNKSWHDENVVLFGHGLLDGSMFGSISDLFTDNYFDKKDNHYITIATPEGISTYEIFSIYIINAEEYYITPSFANKNDFQAFINTISKRSYVNLKVEVTSDDNILTLSTCHGSGDTDQRKVVHAKKLHIEEDK